MILVVLIVTPNSIKPNQGQTDNSVITSPLKTQKDLDNPKITHSKTSSIHSPIPNGQITSDQQNINPTTDWPMSSFPPSLPPALKNSKATYDHSSISEAVTALEPPRSVPPKTFNPDKQPDISPSYSSEAFKYLVALYDISAASSKISEYITIIDKEERDLVVARRD